MKKFIFIIKITMLIILIILPRETPGYIYTNKFFDKPLFNYKVHLNHLPYGNFVLIKSFRKTSQILISKDWGRLFFYTDRNNTKVDDIFVSTYSLYTNTISNDKMIRQDKFDDMLKFYLLTGDKRNITTHKFSGLIYHMEKLKNKNITLKKRGTTYYITSIGDKKNIESLIIDIRLKRLHIRNEYINQMNPNVKDVIYNVHINETWDKSIISIINSHAFLLRNAIKIRD